MAIPDTLRSLITSPCRSRRRSSPSIWAWTVARDGPFSEPVTKKLSLDESWVVSPMQKGQTLRPGECPNGQAGDLSNIKRNVAWEPLRLTLFTAEYQEQVTWRDAATGRLIAESNRAVATAPMLGRRAAARPE